MYHQPWFRAVLIIVVTLSAYSFVLGAPFRILDDQTSIVHNPSIRDPKQIKELFVQGYFNDRSYYRPLVNLSYMAEYQAFKLNPFYYHLDNLLLHVLNAFLVWALVGLLIPCASVGFWVAFLFAIHPIHVEAVSSISGRAILMGAFFSLSALIFFLRYEQKKQWVYLAAVMVSFTLGLLCKESTAVLPGVILVYLWSKKKPILASLWPFAAVVVAYVGIRMSLGLTQTFPWNSWTERVLGFTTFVWTLFMDAWLFVFPVGLHFDRSQSMFRSLSEPLFLLTIVMVGALVYLAWIKRQKISTWTWFLMGWFALEMLPVSQIVTTIGVAPGVISCADHFLYVASIPIFIMMIQLYKKVWQYNEQQRWINGHVFKSGVVVVLVFWVAMNVEQNIYANNERDLFEQSLRIQPNNARAHSSLGLIYAQNKEFAKAQEHFVAAVSGDLSNPRYRISLAQSVCDQGRYKECLDLYNEIEEVGKYGQLLKNNKEAAKRLFDQHV